MYRGFQIRTYPESCVNPNRNILDFKIIQIIGKYMCEHVYTCIYIFYMQQVLTYHADKGF